MANTRPTNQGNKRRRTTYHNRIDLNVDYGLIRSRDTTLNFYKHSISTPRATTDSGLTWVVGDSWGPLDDREFGLDRGCDLFDQAFAQDIIEVDVPGPAPRHQKKSQVSVRIN